MFILRQNKLNWFSFVQEIKSTGFSQLSLLGIPSTLNEPCYTAEGSIDEKKVKLSQDTATVVYIDRLSGTTFNGKEIYFTKG